MCSYMCTCTDILHAMQYIHTALCCGVVGAERRAAGGALPEQPLQHDLQAQRASLPAGHRSRCARALLRALFPALLHVPCSALLFLCFTSHSIVPVYRTPYRTYACCFVDTRKRDTRTHSYSNSALISHIETCWGYGITKIFALHSCREHVCTLRRKLLGAEFS